jgi:hypothetical protein
VEAVIGQFKIKNSSLWLCNAPSIDLEQRQGVPFAYDCANRRAAMNTIQALMRTAERDAAIIDAIQQAVLTLRMLRVAGGWIDLKPDIERLTGALTLLGYSEPD